ncbi:unnamed protein product, partial [Vitis vinifera]
MLIQRKRSQRRLLFLVKTLSTLYINETQLYSHQCLQKKKESTRCCSFKRTYSFNVGISGLDLVSHSVRDGLANFVSRHNRCPQTLSPPLLRHRLGRISLGHLHWQV